MKFSISLQIPILIFALFATAFSIDERATGQDQESRDSKEHAEIESFFENFVETKEEEGHFFNIDPFVDVDAFVMTLLEVIDQEDSVTQRLALNVALKQKLQEQMASEITRWVRFTLPAVELSDERDEAVVMFRGWKDDGLSVRQRFWLRKKDDDWKIVDIEDVALNLRVSTLMKTLAGDLFGAEDILVQSERMHAMEQAINAMAIGDYYTGGDYLRSIDGQPLPEALESVRWVLKGVVAVFDYDPELALRCFDRANEFQADIPIVPYNRAVALNMLGRSSEALESALTFTDRYGIDADAQLEIGNALESLGRKQEAIEAYRLGLEDSPNSLDNLVSLGIALPVGEKGEISEHFVRLSFPERDFEPIAQTFQYTDDMPALKEIVTTFREQFPENPVGVYYQAIYLTYDEDHNSALEILADVLDNVPEEEQYDYVQLFCECAVWAGRPIYAYDLAPNKRDAFDWIIRLLIEDAQWEVSDLLLERHLEVEPDDPMYHYFQADVYYGQEMYREADEAYARVPLDSDDDWFADDIRRSRVYCWYHLGKQHLALRKFRPTEETLNDLAELAFADEDYEKLTGIVESYEELESKDNHAKYWRLVVGWKVADDLETTVATGMDLLEEYDSEWDYIGSWQVSSVEEIVIRCLLKLNHHRKALKLAKESTEFDGAPYFLTLVYVMSKRTDKVREVMPELLRMGYSADYFFEDEDMGPLFRDDPDLAELRQWMEQQFEAEVRID